MRRSVVMYARISIATEESVSIARQLEAGRQYARARGWKLVGTYVDEGVSATRARPADRAGLDSPAQLAGALHGRGDLEGRPTRAARRGLPPGPRGPADPRSGHRLRRAEHRHDDRRRPRVRSDAGRLCRARGRHDLIATDSRPSAPHGPRALTGRSPALRMDDGAQPRRRGPRASVGPRADRLGPRHGRACSARRHGVLDHGVAQRSRRPRPEGQGGRRATLGLLGRGPHPEEPGTRGPDFLQPGQHCPRGPRSRICCATGTAHRSSRRRPPSSASRSTTRSCTC